MLFKVTARSANLITTLVLTLLIPAGAGASISVSQSIDRTDMAFEDTASFQIIVSWEGPAHTYRFDKAFRLQADRLKVVRFSSAVSSTGSGDDEITTKIFDYRLAPVLSGLATVQPLVIEYISWPDSLVGELSTDPITISIAEPVPAGIAEEEGFSGGWMAVIAVCVIGVVVGVFSVLKRRAPQEKTRNPAETFLDELGSIKDDSGMDLKKFQTGLYRSLVDYINNQYHLELAGQTAEAVTAQLEKVESRQNVRETLSGWLARAEKEKYSPMAAAPGEVMRLESEIREFFEKLK